MNRVHPLVLIASLMLAGCVVPFPSTTRVAPAVNGTVHNQRTGGPVAGAVIRSERARFSAQALSRADGSYAVQKIDQNHFLMFLPYPFPLPAPWTERGEGDSRPLRVTASAAGYQTQSVELQRPFDCEVVSRGVTIEGKKTAIELPGKAVVVNFTLAPKLQ